MTSSSGNKGGSVAPIHPRNNGSSAPPVPPSAATDHAAAAKAVPAALDSADGEELKPIQLLSPPIHLPIDKAGSLINGVAKLELRRSTDDEKHVPTEQQQQSSEDGGLVMMTILPDEKGRFGFNVKGGADQKMPIIVSRVGVNTPADRYSFFVISLVVNL